MEYNLYFDNSATSHPKPKELEEAAITYLRRGGSYGRSSYGKAIENTKVVERCRNMLSGMFGVSAENLFFTKNATEAATLIISSLNLRAKRVLCSPLEHNAIMRPLKSVGAVIELFECDSDGRINIEKAKLIDYTSYDLVCVNHVSNVNGVVQPIAELASLVEGKTELFVDATQSVGAFEFEFLGDYVVFTGHKSLLGAAGIGGFYVKNPDALTPLVYGGTGSNSESFEMPSFTPDKFEAGTINIIGIEMLLAAISNRPTPLHSRDDFKSLINHLSLMENVELYKANDFVNQAQLFSLRFKNIGVSSAANKIYQDFGVEIRKGLHCSPLAHKTLGTFSDGTLRFSLSPYHTIDDLNYLCRAIEAISTI